MTRFGEGLFRAALRLVPPEWRGSVERELRDEGAAFPAFAAAAVGMRIRGARLRDGFDEARLANGLVVRDMCRDIRFAARDAIRRPAQAAAVVATLAIGIGAGTAIYSVFNWILFRPVPRVERPDELVTVRFRRPSSDGRFFVSYRDYADLRDGVRALSGLAASAAMPLNVAFGSTGDAERVESEMVTSNYFDVLGVKFDVGRGFGPSDETVGANTPPAVISHALWRRAFASQSAALGRQLIVNGHAFTVIGVAPEGFQGGSLVTVTDVWVPIGAHMAVDPGNGADLLTNRRRTLFIDAIGRLRPGATLAQAQEQALAVATAVQDFGGRRPADFRRGPPLPALFHGLTPDVYTLSRLTTVWRLLMGAVGLLLLLACANAANLLLARALDRRREIAVRQAIGASRFRLVRQQLTEGVLLSLLAAGAGLLLARSMTSLFDGMRILNYLPALTGVAVDWRVGAFTLAVGIATGVLFSLAPAFASSRIDLQQSLKDGLTGSRRGDRLRSALVTLQIAISVLLLVGAGLFVRTLQSLRALDLGLRLDGLVSFSVDPTSLGYTEAAGEQYFERLLERLRRVPGISAAAFSWRTPYSNIGSGVGFRRDDEAEGVSRDAESNTISPGYFAALGTPLLAGRDFTEDEFRRAAREDGYDAVIVNQRLARTTFPQGGAVGSSLVLEYPKGKRVRIIGIVGDIRGRPVTNEPEPCLFMPGTVSWGSINVRSSMPLAQTAAAIRDVARAVDPLLLPYDLEPMSAGVDRLISEQRLFARLSAIFAVVALALAAIGVYGMMAGAVAERRREFGIRLALGADAGNVRALVLTGALPAAAGGLFLGLMASVGLQKPVEAYLFGVKASDPLTLTTVIVVLLAVALGASLIPARRAARVDPMQSLRAD